MKAAKTPRSTGSKSKTHFAPAERSAPFELQREVRKVSRNAVIDGLVSSVGGLLAVLNEHRQVLAVNDSLLDMLGLKDSTTLLGLRPGEVVGCVHARQPPHGCGTTEYCATCGAVIAMVTSLQLDLPVERTCALEVQRGGRPVDLFLSVRSCPVDLDGQRLLILFLQDITRQQTRAALERVFFHDLNNMLLGLVGTSELLVLQPGERTEERLQRVQQLAHHLAQEISLQKCLAGSDSDLPPRTVQAVSTHQVFRELHDLFLGHPAAAGKTLCFPNEVPDLTLQTDLNLLLRVLGNMTCNAFEATLPGGEVRAWLEKADGTAVFCVWNGAAIPADVARRVFQRNFSTKGESGRGLGTFSMKLFGERFLGGEVGFTSSEAAGTVFRFRLPC
jgi:signal transduction histidine kinase